MAEHFVARLRGLWLAFPDQTVVTAREGRVQPAAPPPTALPDAAEAGPPVVDRPCDARPSSGPTTRSAPGPSSEPPTRTPAPGRRARRRSVAPTAAGSSEAAPGTMTRP
jgi:hypothetical protein